MIQRSGARRTGPFCSGSGTMLSVAEVKGAMVSDFEECLNTLDVRLQEIQKAGKAVVSAATRARTAAKLGRASEITRLLDDITRRIGDIRSAAGDLSQGWNFDTATYLA